jgi:hypothetical protein
MPKPMLGMRTLSSAHAKIARIKGNGVKLSLYECTLACQGVHAKLYDGVNVSQENNDDVAMFGVALHYAVTNEEPGVNTEPMATGNDVFRNMLAEDTKHEDDIS